MTERGMFRKDASQIEIDMANQETARKKLQDILNMEVKPQHEFSIWDWEIYKNNELKGIAEYRRRFMNFGKYPDFQFSKKKFYAMKSKASDSKIPAYMVVEFDNALKFFTIEGQPEEKIMQRRGEVRTEEVVVINNQDFKDVTQTMENTI